MSTANAQNPVKVFVHQLMRDELLLNRFQANRSKTLEAVDLEFEDEQREALLRGDESTIRDHLGDTMADFVAIFIAVA